MRTKADDVSRDRLDCEARQLRAANPEHLLYRALAALQVVVQGVHVAVVVMAGAGDHPHAASLGGEAARIKASGEQVGAIPFKAEDLCAHGSR